MYQVRFTTKGMVYHKDMDDYFEAKIEAEKVVREHPEAIAVGIITPAGIEVIKKPLK